jgi:membrane protease YdiL (CAAX protease family)
MWLVLPYLLPLGIIVMANLGVTRRRWRQITYVSLALLSAATWIVGLLLLALPYLQRLTQAPPELVVQGLRLRGFGVALSASAILSLACLVTPVRGLLARCFPIDPASPVHATALVFVIYLAAISLALLISGGEWLLEGIQVSNIDPWLLVLGQAVFLLFALAGVGLGIRRSLRQVLHRLDLRALTLRQLGIAAFVILTFLALDWVVSQLWRQLWPVNYRVVAEASEYLFGRFVSPMGALLLGLSAGIGEETLFRGALQPRLRIPLTAVLFALGHVQYTLSPAILEILVIGLALGWLRERTNTTACIVVHSGYNFLNVLLLPYLT